MRVSVMESLGSLFCVSVLFLKCILAKTSFQDQSKLHKKHAAIFVFGDSPYDPGNNNFLNITKVGFKANFPPYGETFFKFPTGRFSDGRLIPDFLALQAHLPLWRPYLAPGQHQFIHGANFASAGALALADNKSVTLNLHIQLSNFKEVSSSLNEQLGDAEAKKLLMNAVYLSSIGGVDYMMFGTTYPNATESQKLEYVKLVIGNITDVVREIYEVGGRKFAFQNVAPLGCVPIIKQTYNLSKDSCLEDVQALARLHNHALFTAATELQTQLPGFKYIVFDYFSTLMDLTFNPLKHGFKVADIACCGSGMYHASDCGIGEYELCNNPNEYVYWDSDHVTDHGNFQLAQLFWNGGKNVTTPFNLKQLFELEFDDEIKFQNLIVDSQVNELNLSFNMNSFHTN